MTQLSRGAMLVRGMNALRVFHGHVAFCRVCKPIMDAATSDKVQITLREVKQGFCDNGRKSFKRAFSSTGKRLWGMLEPTPKVKKHEQTTPDSTQDSQAQAEASDASSDFPQTD